jgi:hypothetical protein
MQGKVGKGSGVFSVERTILRRYAKHGQRVGRLREPDRVSIEGAVRGVLQ